MNGSTANSGGLPQNYQFLSELRRAVQDGVAAKVHAMLPNMPDVDFRYERGATLLNYASAEPDVDIVRMLLDAGADPNTADDRGITPLHCAAAHGLHNIIELLLAAGANVHARSIYRGITPLHEAKDLVTLRLLVDAGANIHARDQDGNTPLHWALWDGRTEVGEDLIPRGANPWLANDQGLTPQDDQPDNWWDQLAEMMKEWQKAEDDSQGP